MSAVHERVGMPLSEFIELTNDAPFELINGERIPRVPTITRHNEAIDKFSAILKVAAEATGIGIVRVEATYVLPDRYDSNWVTGSRTPDILFISADRLAAYKQANPQWEDTPYLIVPDLVVEVISPNDKFTEVNVKVNSYLEDGVRLVVLVDPSLRTAIVHAPNLQPLHLSGDTALDLGHVIPGFTVPLSALFT